MPETDYKTWISTTEASQQELAAMRRQVAGFEYLPKISLILVVSDADEVWIKSSIDSVISQIYPRLELCVCDNGSVRPHVPEVLEDYTATEERIKVRRLSKEKSRAGAYNAALSMSTGEYVALLGQDDEIASDALFKVVEFLQDFRADVIYTNEDSIDVSGGRSDPIFKPYYSPDLLLSTAYTGRMCVMRKSLLEAPEAFRDGIGEAEEQDLLLRLSERTDSIRHLPGMLYHRRKLPELEMSGNSPGRASARVIEEALERREEDATVQPGLVRGSFRVFRSLHGRPRVSVIVSVPEGAAGVPLVKELKRETSYPIHQVILASAGYEAPTSNDHVSHPFLARALNLAADKAESEYLAFVDGRARITNPEWLWEMVSQAQRPDVGAVGCRLLNQDGTLRHGGTFIETSRLVDSLDEPVFDKEPPPLVDLAPFNFTAASAECMVVRATVFEEAEGFDDERLPATFYDLDLCFRLREKGLLNLYTPYASMVCGSPGPSPGEGEIGYMWRRWWEELVRLLYYRWSPLHAGNNGVYSGAQIFLSS